MTSFAEVVQKLPAVLQTWINTEGFTDFHEIADAAQPVLVYMGGGNKCQKMADQVFVEAIAEVIPDLKPVTRAWSQAVTFYRTCWDRAQEKDKASSSQGTLALTGAAAELKPLEPDILCDLGQDQSQRVAHLHCVATKIRLTPCATGGTLGVWVNF